MGGDDWIHKIRKEREAAQAKTELENRIRLENRRNYEAKCEAFWARVVAELERVVGVFNEGSGLAYELVIEKQRNYVAAVMQLVGALQVQIEHEAQRVTATQRIMMKDGSREDRPTSYQVVSTKDGDLVFQPRQGPEEFVRSIAEPFFRRIGGVG